MTGSSSGVRKRQGCRQCKTKRLKCDEGTPACTNCLRRGLQCPGYGKTLRWSTKHERFGLSFSQRQDGQSNKPSPQEALPTPSDNIAQDQGLDDGSHSIVAGNEESHSSFYYTGGNDSSKWLLPNAHPFNDPWHGQSLQPSSTLQSIQVSDHARFYGDSNHFSAQDTSRSSRASDGMDMLSSLTDTQKPPFDPAMFYTPTHLPTILIEYWFNDVCPMWSIFDSDANFNRRFASMTWASSEPVFYAMQSMSAACLVDTMPTVMPVLSSLTSKALAAIRSRVLFFQNDERSIGSGFPADLLFAIFAMGTSLHWKFGYELGRSLIEDASLIIGYYKSRLPSLNLSDRECLGFFQKALICWEGLLSAADRNFAPTAFVARRRAYQARIMAGRGRDRSQRLVFGPPAITLSDAEIHPWCGVSSDVLQKFGQVLSLCHIARRRGGNDDANANVEQDSDTGLAHELASELSAMDFSAAPWHSSSIDARQSVTKDDDTPISHLLGVAEAYRQACFLQLCLTFEDITFDDGAYPSLGLAAPDGGGHNSISTMTRAQGLVGLALKLVEQLKQIPPESGSRCMQPVLYLCAASGLQIVSASSQDVKSSSSECSEVSSVSGDPSSGTRAQEAYHRRGQGLGHLPFQELNTDKVFTMSDFKVSQARSFVKRRLGMLQQLLPPTYAGTALRLAQAIWAEYDCTEGGGSPLYWFDVMVREKLQTFFG